MPLSSLGELPNTIEVLRLRGTPERRGNAFGAASAGSIARWLDAWLGNISAAGIRDPHAYISEFLERTNFRRDVERLVPDLCAEVEAIAGRSNQNPDLVWAAQFMDEEWAYRLEIADSMSDKCSSAAIISQPGLTWIGQNMDLARFNDGFQRVLNIASRGQEPGALIFTVGPMIGLMGVNDAGIGVFVNAMPQLPAVREGLPVAFVLRRLLQATSLDECESLVFALPHATSQHYLIADPYRILSFEATPVGVVALHDPDTRRLVHTNHPLAVHDKLSTERPVERSSTSLRLAALTARLLSGAPDRGAIAAALSSCDDPHFPVCRSGGDSDGDVTGFTCGSMIATLRSEGPIEVLVSAGPPATRRYSRMELERRKTT